MSTFICIQDRGAVGVSESEALQVQSNWIKQAHFVCVDGWLEGAWTLSLAHSSFTSIRSVSLACPLFLVFGEASVLLFIDIRSFSGPEPAEDGVGVMCVAVVYK